MTRNQSDEENEVLKGKYSITSSADGKFVYKSYRYDRLEDALNYARIDVSTSPKTPEIPNTFKSTGFFSRQAHDWAVKKQRKEMQGFVDLLRGMDGDEIAVAVVFATHTRHIMEKQGHNVLDPILYFATNPSFTHSMSVETIQLQKQGRLQEAAAMMIWVHSFRAATSPELRLLGREMWKHLERGFPYVDKAAETVGEMTGFRLNIEGAKSFPVGLTPEPL